MCTQGTRFLKIMKIYNFQGDLTNISAETKALQVIYLAFSAHADAKGILQLIQHVRPGNVVLVHGEASKMRFLEQRVRSTLNTPCFAPANGETLRIPVRSVLPVHVSGNALLAAQRIAGAHATASVLGAVAATGRAGSSAIAGFVTNLKAALEAEAAAQVENPGETGGAGVATPAGVVHEAMQLMQQAEPTPQVCYAFLSFNTIRHTLFNDALIENHFMSSVRSDAAALRTCPRGFDMMFRQFLRTTRQYCFTLFQNRLISRVTLSGMRSVYRSQHQREDRGLPVCSWLDTLESIS